jgi:hypothetical protein
LQAFPHENFVIEVIDYQPIRRAVLRNDVVLLQEIL